MSIAVLIYGESGTGKSTSIRSLDPSTTAIVNVLGKPLPFSSNGYKKQEGRADRMLSTDDYKTITTFIHKVNASSLQTLIIDDFQYLMANEFMRKSREKGFDKFTEIARNAWDLLSLCCNLREDLKVYFLSHSETTQDGKVKTKTIGKLLDEKITIEGMFSIVLYSVRNEHGYKFLTQNTGNVISKSPVGLFDSEYIDNDLAYTNERINDYYSINKDVFETITEEK